MIDTGSIEGATVFVDGEYERRSFDADEPFVIHRMTITMQHPVPYPEDMIGDVPCYWYIRSHILGHDYSISYMETKPYIGTFSRVTLRLTTSGWRLTQPAYGRTLPNTAILVAMQICTPTSYIENEPDTEEIGRIA